MLVQMKTFHSCLRPSNISLYIYIATVLLLLLPGALLLLIGLHLLGSLLFLLVLKWLPPMINKTAHSIGPSHAPSLLEVVNGCLSWRNFQLLHGKYYFPEKENNDNSDNNNKEGLFSSCGWKSAF